MFIYKVAQKGQAGEMGKSKPLTETEWARRANAMRLEIDEYSASISPAEWASDEHLKDMKRRYLKMVGVITQRSTWPGETQ